MRPVVLGGGRRYLGGAKRASRRAPSRRRDALAHRCGFRRGSRISWARTHQLSTLPLDRSRALLRCPLRDQGRGCAAPGRPPPVRLTAGTPALRRFAPHAPPPLTSRARPAWTESSSWQTIFRTSPEPPTRRRSIRPTPGCIKGADASLRDDLRPPMTRPLRRALVLRYGLVALSGRKKARTGKHAHAELRTFVEVVRCRG